MSAAAGTTLASPWSAHAAEVLDVTDEFSGVATYHLRLRDATARQSYACRPGQFNMLYLPSVGEAAISVSGYDPATDAWLHTIRTAGNVTREIERLGRGGRLALRGPFGVSWPVERLAGRDVLIVAGGIGLAPLRPAVEWCLSQRGTLGRVTVLYGARSPSTLLYRGQLAQWERAGLRVETTVDRAETGWRGNVGVIPLLLDRLRPLEPQRTTLLTCGPEVMMRYVARSALARGIDATDLWVSLERHMQCAVGFCGHCQLGPALICRDGPVFRYDRMAAFMDMEDL